MPEVLTDLLAEAGVAEIRADHLDLGLLMAQPTLLHDGVESPTLPLVQRFTDRLTLQLPFASVADKELRLSARSIVPARDGYSLDVSLNGQALGRLRLGGKTKDFSFPLPAANQREGVNELGVDLHRGHGGYEISRLEVGSGPEGSLPSIQSEKRGLWLPAGTGRRFHIRLSGPSDLVLVARGETGAGLTVSAVSETGSVQLARENQPSVRRRIRIPGGSGAFVRLDLQCEGRGGLWLEQLALASARNGVDPEPVLPPQRRSVVIFLSDTLRADHLGAYGYRAPTSPRFDAFAKASVLFEDAQAVSSWTRPTVASLFTGQGPVTHGVGSPRHPLAISLNTMAETARAAGYETAAFVANPVVPDSFSRGFQTWNREALTEKRPGVVVSAALDWIRTASRPFLLYIHVLEPHAPYEPAPEHWERFRPRNYRGDPDPVAVLGRIRNDGRHSPGDLEFVVSAYDAEIHETDAAFGRLLDGLKDRELLESSLVVFTADHGEEFFDHGGEGHGSTLYQEVLRVPLALRIPGQPGRSSTLAIDQSDLAPTLFGLAGVRPPPGMDGRDLSPFVSSGLRPQHDPPRLAHLHYGEPDTDPNLYSARVGGLKLIVHRETGRSSASRLELYDLSADPRETRNLAAERPLAAGYLLARIELVRTAQMRSRDRLQAGRPDARPEAEEALKALGYVR